MKFKIFLSILFLLLVNLNINSVVEEPKVYADRTEVDENILKAYGHVEIRWEDYRIFADYLEYNEKTKEVIAKGRVTMASKETSISGDNLRFNIEKMSGEIFDTHGLMPPSIKYTSKKLIQTDRNTLKFDRMEFTSCSQLVPRWKLICRKGKIKKEKYIEMKSGVLKIKNIPVFYFPYLRYPIKGRSTGFLFPQFGHSSEKGFFVNNAFYLDIRSNIDLTLYLDRYSDLGTGIAGEFRYLFEKMGGTLKYYRFIYNKNIETYDDSRPESGFDYYVKAGHIQSMKFLNTKIVFSVDKQSDPGFLRIFNNDFERVLRANFASSVYITSSVSNLNFSVRASTQETFYTFNNTSRKTEYLPSLKANLNQQKFWKIPGYFTINTAFERVKRSGKSYEEEPLYTSDISSQRIKIMPSYTLNLFKLPWLSTTIDIKSNQTIYAKSRDLDTKEIVNKSLHLQYNTASANVKGPVFYKIYDFSNNKIKHLIEPQLNIRYVTKYSDEDRQRLVTVDYLDYPSYSYVGFSLTSRLLYKSMLENKSSIEILSFTIAQKFYFDPGEANMYRKIEGEYPKFSELSNRIRFRPSKYLSLDASIVYNYYINKFSRLNVNLSYSNKESFLNGSIGFSSYKNPYVTDSNYIFNRDIIRGNIDFNLPGFPIKFTSGLDYDITNKEFKHGSVMAIFNFQCINITAEMKIFSWVGRTETQFRFGVTFGNLGMVSDFMGRSEH
jgi:lipopolysaccharide assembly outer membrane protein LptD (OstA)